MRRLLPLLISLCAFGAVAAQEAGWPRQIDNARATVVVYQPQIEGVEEDDILGRAAVSVTPTGSSAPIFGVIWVRARMITDRDERTVEIVDVDVTDVRFANASEENKEKLAKLVEEEAESWDLVISLDRVLTSLAANAREADLAAGIKHDPPVILYADDPAVLVLLDGQPRFGPLREDDLRRIVNSPYTLVRDEHKKKHRYYLDGGIYWYTATAVEGPWSVDKKPPKRVRELRPAQAEADAKSSMEERGKEPPPRVVIATEPTELILTSGAAEFSPIAGTGLLYVSNTESDLFLDTATQDHYIVLSGRWYRAKALPGPWAHVAPGELPDEFAAIPPASEKGNVLVFVAGTPAAQEALLDNQIPQTAAVRRGVVNLKVTYDGVPVFKPISGTNMEYAVNTRFSVLKIGGVYWVCDQAVWYQGPTPQGPWTVADHRPDEVKTIPPSNPHYNTKYVYVYDSTPDVVYVGYTPAYVGSYPYGGCVVYGTGWYYPGWYGTVYYPYPYTYGFSMTYSSWYGWGGAVSWSNGPFTVSFGYVNYPSYGWWGPGGYAYRPPYYYHGHDYNRPPGWNHPGWENRPGWDNRPGNPGDRPGNPGNRPGDPGERPIAPGGKPGQADRERLASGRDNIYNRPENRERVANREGGGRRPGYTGDRPNNVYAGRDGNVYRRGENGGWQQRDGGGWRNTDPGRADRGGSSSRGSDRARSTPSRGSGLDQSHRARQQGSQRSQGYGHSRSAGSTSRGSMGGRSRGGGGRRR